MNTVNIRRQGGAAIITIPPYVLKKLNLEIGESLELEVTDEELTVRPAHKATRKRYSLTELMQGTSPKAIKSLNNETHWAREGKAVGPERT